MIEAARIGRRRLGSILCFGAAILLNMAPAAEGKPQGAGDGAWPVEGKLVGEARADGGFKKSKDVSGFACATGSGFPRVCLVADDETQGAQIVVLNEGGLVAGDVIRLIADSHEGEILELDAEGAAFADGAFYVIGSHGRPRHGDGDAQDGSEKAARKNAEIAAKTRATRHVFRLRIDPRSVDDRGRLSAPAEITDSAELSRFIAAEPALAPAFDGKLAENGLSIEGVAVRDGRLFAGMRGPLLEDGQAAILSVPLGALFDGQSGTARLHRIDLMGRRGIRDLTVFEDGFLVIAGPVDDPPGGETAAGDYAVVWWDGGTATRVLAELPYFGRRVKPEALLPLDRGGGRLRVLMFFDGPADGAPKPMEIDLP